MSKSCFENGCNGCEDCNDYENDQECAFEQPAKPWERCKDHGPARQNVWACPACLVELREENKRIKDAAQDLLSVLQEVLPMLEAALMITGEPEPGSVGYRARAAIAKALGK